MVVWGQGGLAEGYEGQTHSSGAGSSPFPLELPPRQGLCEPCMAAEGAPMLVLAPAPQYLLLGKCVRPSPLAEWPLEGFILSKNLDETSFLTNANAIAL